MASPISALFSLLRFTNRSKSRLCGRIERTGFKNGSCGTCSRSTFDNLPPVIYLGHSSETEKSGSNKGSKRQ